MLAVITHQNAPKLNIKGGIRGGTLLQSAAINFYGQHIGVVVAETFEQARHTAQMVKVEYKQTVARTDFKLMKNEAVTPKDNPDVKRGDTITAFKNAEFKIESIFETPVEHHHPMEPHATIASWEGEKLTFYNGAQIVNGAQSAAAATLGIPVTNVRIITPHIGGGFGSKGWQWANLVLAAIASRIVKRPVKMALILAVTGAGKILNPKTARSQIIGGVVWGIGMALTEESVIDERWGNFITRSFADYHVPSNLDIGSIETIFIDEKDTITNNMGIKGIGEVGIVGVAGAVVNAIFNATGKRVRELPVTPDKLL